MKIAVISGTSTGIGLASAVGFARAGYAVFAGMRNLAKADALRDIVEREALSVTVVPMDVTDGASVAEAFARVEESGPVDVLVNNAGIGGASPLELTPEDEHRSIFEVNYFGAIRCIQAVLPSMRERGSGAILNVTSMEGIVATPNQVAYSASKWALECAGEALAHEVYRFGVRVMNIEPGVVQTKIFENSAPATRYIKGSPYQTLMRRNGKMFAAGFRIGTAPEAVADAMLEAVESSETAYRLRWPVGEDALSMAAGRRRISDEQWVEMGADLSDQEYSQAYRDYFGIDL